MSLFKKKKKMQRNKNYSLIIAFNGREINHIFPKTTYINLTKNIFFFTCDYQSKYKISPNMYTGLNQIYWIIELFWKTFYGISSFWILYVSSGIWDSYL